VANPLNLRLAPKELGFILADSGTKVCFTDAFFAPVINRVREEAGLEHIVMIGDGDAPHDAGYEAVLAAATPALPDEPDEDDPVILMYTGGTTGTPKGVLLDHRAEMLNMYHVAMAWRIGESEVFLHQTPMFHAASMSGIVGVPAVGGVSVCVPLFDPVAVMDAIEQHKVTMTVMVPTMIGMLLSHEAFRPERLKSLVRLTYGASPMPAALLDKLLQALPALDVYQGYGMTECAAVLTVLGPDEHRAGGVCLRSAGRPVQGVTLSIQDADGKPVPTGVTGEVCARGGNFMREYWKRPDATADAFRGGWYHTGDAGYRDERGYVFLVDRVKDMIVTGGENVYSIEVENAIASHP
jgi:acyl-CoA synthetase (AMP-forming)/AMP-acid ligase II